MSQANKRILVVGIGNVLRGDDGFGPAVVQHLHKLTSLPPGVKILEMGIGGMDMILELMEGYDALVIIDAVERGQAPGSLFELEPLVPEADAVPPLDAWGWSSDTCQTLPSRALVMAQAAGVLPPLVRIVGCQPGQTEDFSTELSHSVSQAVPLAVENILNLLKHWSGEPHARPAG